MAIQKTKAFLLLCIIFSLYSCSKDIELNMTLANPTLVINSLLTPNEAVTVRLTSTTSILDSTYPNIENAQVTLFEDGNAVSKLKQNSEGLYTSEYHPKAGSVYKITASASGFDSVIAVDSIPSNYPDIKDIAFRYPSVIMEDITFGKLSIQLKDPENRATSFYEIILTTEMEFGGKIISNYVNFYAANKAVTIKDWDPPYPNTILFTNQSFPGKLIDFTVFVNNNTCPIVKVRRVSYNYYKFKTTLYLHQYTQAWNRETMDDFFKGEPVEMYSNIENGFGIFASYAEYQYIPE